MLITCQSLPKVPRLLLRKVLLQKELPLKWWRSRGKSKRRFSMCACIQFRPLLSLLLEMLAQSWLATLLLSLMWPKPTLLTNSSQISIHQKWKHYWKSKNAEIEMLLNRVPYLKCDIQLSDTKCHPKQKLCCWQGYVKSRVLSKTVIWVFC